MGLDDAMRRVEDARRARSDQQDRFDKELAAAMADLQREIDELAAESYEWLQANPRPQTILGYAELEAGRLGPTRNAYGRPTAEGYTIVHEWRGWHLGRLFLKDNGELCARKNTDWFSSGPGGLGGPPEGWEERLAREAQIAGVKRIWPSRSPVYTYGKPGLSVLKPLRAVWHPTSSDPDPGDIYRGSDGQALSAHNDGGAVPLSDRIAAALLSL